MIVSYETVRRWCAKFGQAYADGLRRRRPGLGINGIWTPLPARRHLMTAPEHRAEMTIRFAIWDQITGAVGRPTTA